MSTNRRCKKSRPSPSRWTSKLDCQPSELLEYVADTEKADRRARLRRLLPGLILIASAVGFEPEERKDLLHTAFDIGSQPAGNSKHERRLATGIEVLVLALGALDMQRRARSPRNLLTIDHAVPLSIQDIDDRLHMCVATAMGTGFLDQKAADKS